MNYIYFSGTTPQHLRFHLLSSDPADASIIVVWYAGLWRRNVFADRGLGFKYIEPLSSELPECTQESGSNYFDREKKLLYLLVRGSATPTHVDIETQEQIFVQMRFMTTEEFFGPQIVANLADFLGIAKENIIEVNVSPKVIGRRKRATEVLARHIFYLLLTSKKHVRLYPL